MPYTADNSTTVRPPTVSVASAFEDRSPVGRADEEVLVVSATSLVEVVEVTGISVDIARIICVEVEGRIVCVAVEAT